LINGPLGRDGDFYGPYGSISPNGSWYETHYGWPFSFLMLEMPTFFDPAMRGDEPFSYSFSPTALVANTVMIAQKYVSVPRSIAWIASCADNIAGPQGSRFARITLTLRRATFHR
jgi:hypothetical protein